MYLKKYGMKVKAGLKWLMMTCNGRLLVTLKNFWVT